MGFLRFLRDNAAFLLAGFLLSFTSSFGQTFFISIFAGEIRGDFGLSNGEWGAIYTAGTTASAVLMIWAGALTDRFRVRFLCIAMLGCLALSCLAMAAVPSAALLVGVIFLLRFFGQGMTSQLAVVSMVRWFVRARGRALSIAAMGFALGQALLPIIFVSLMQVYDWRWLWVGSAGLVVLAILPVVMLLRLERTPQSIAAEAPAAGMDGRQWSRTEVLRHPLFWAIVPTILGPSALSTSLFFHQVHLTAIKGWTLVDFVALMPLFTAVTVAATFASGSVVDRLGAGRLMPVMMLPFGAAFAILAFAPTIPVAAIGLVVMALGQGIQATAPGAFWAEHFGTRHLGSIKAAAVSVMVFGSAIGPGITGVLIDLGIPFPTQMYGFALYFVLAAILASWGVARARLRLPLAA